jgi:hypothetical protein
MAIRSLVWKLASPYDAYVSHVSQLNEAIGRIQYLSDKALAYEAGLQGSVRLVPGAQDPADRARRFRERIGTAAEEMSEEQFEEFISHLGGGEVATGRPDVRRQLRANHLPESTVDVFRHHLAELGRRVGKSAE